jgi:hypothetical protein
VKKNTSDVVAWSGWDPRSGAHAVPEALKKFEAAAPPFPNSDARYDLLAVAARGFRPPQALTATSVEDGNREVLNADEFPGLRLTWTTLYRQIAETAPMRQRPYAIYLLGVNPPADVSDAELETFNDFYTNVHLVEVAERRHALRAVRYELIEEIKAPYLGAPRFLAVYEVDEQSAAQRRHVGPPYSTGPDVWQRHSTPWRLWYRRLGQ